MFVRIVKGRVYEKNLQKGKCVSCRERIVAAMPSWKGTIVTCYVVGGVARKRCCFGSFSINPSTASAMDDDATLRRLITFSKREEYGRLEVVNLYAWRSTGPKELRRGNDPIEPRNNTFIEEAASRADKISVGWGNGPFHFREREVLDLLTNYYIWTFGLTQNGHLRHPLYLKSSEPSVFPPFSCVGKHDRVYCKEELRETIM